MEKFRLMMYMILVNILPFLMFDLFYRWVDSTILAFLDSGVLWRIVVFIVIYAFVQLILFRSILKNLYKKDLVSNYV